MGIVVKQGNSLLKTGNYILAVKDFTFGYLQNENCVTNHFTTQYRSKIVIDDIAGLFYTITYDETISLPVVGVYSLTDFKLKNTINFGTSFSGGAANSYSLAIDNVKNNVLYVMDSLYIIRVFSLTDYSLVGSILPKAGYQFCDICLKSDGSTLYATTGVYQSAVPTLFSYETNNFNLLKSYSFTPTIGAFSSFPTITYDNSRNELWTFSITNGDPSRCFQILDADTFLLKNTISGNRLSGFSGSNTAVAPYYGEIGRASCRERVSSPV